MKTKDRCAARVKKQDEELNKIESVQRLMHSTCGKIKIPEKRAHLYHTVVGQTTVENKVAY